MGVTKTTESPTIREQELESSLKLENVSPTTNHNAQQGPGTHICLQIWKEKKICNGSS